jgi:outer membrane protein
MKKTLLLLVTVALMGAVNVMGQNSKVGHINSNELLELMPEKTAAAKQVEQHAKQLEDQLRTMSAEYQGKVSEYQNQQALMAEAVKQTKLKEISDLETRIQQFQLSAQEELQKKEAEVLQPIIDKAKKAIDDVAKEKGYDYILDTGLGVVLYSETGDNILPLVKKKLNL